MWTLLSVTLGCKSTKNISIFVLEKAILRRILKSEPIVLSLRKKKQIETKTDRLLVQFQ